MNKKEATKLLALIKIAYPTSYRGVDEATTIATINMWQMSFPDVPYPIMEQAFNHFRMISKFPPTVAEMVEELKQIHLHATECALVHKTLGNEEEVRRYRAIMDLTLRYKDSSNLGLQLSSIPNLLNGGERDVQRFGTPGDRMDRENRLSLLDAGD